MYAFILSDVEGMLYNKISADMSEKWYRPNGPEDQLEQYSCVHNDKCWKYTNHSSLLN